MLPDPRGLKLDTAQDVFQSALRFAVLPDVERQMGKSGSAGFQSALRFAVLPDED